MKSAIPAWIISFFLLAAGASMAQMSFPLTPDATGTGSGKQSNIHYVRAGAGGNGTSWANAWSELPPTLQRGHIYYIADGQYGSYVFDDPLDYANPRLIFVRKATETDHGESLTWKSFYGDGTAVFQGPIKFDSPGWIFNGQKRDTLTSGHGFKIDATNGAKGVQISNSDDASFICVKYTEIAGCGDDGNANGNDLVYITKNVRCILILYCHLHDAGRCPFLFRDCRGVVAHSYIARNESHNLQHSEGISAAWDTTWTICHNFWEDIEGTGVIVFYGHGWKIYGNVMFHTVNAPTNPWLTNGAITTWRDPVAGNVNNSLVYNNTLVNLKGYDSGVYFNSASYANKAYNNVFYKCSSISQMYVHSDWNWYFDNGNGNYLSEPHSEYPAFDPDLFVDPLNFDFRLKRATLNGRDDLGSPFDIDMLHVFRGGDGVWDRGAFEFE